MQDDEALLGSGLHDVPPEGACLDPCAPCCDVDLDAAQARRLHQDRALEPGERAGAVPSPLRGDSQAVRPRELDDLDDVFGGVDKGHRRCVSTPTT